MKREKTVKNTVVTYTCDCCGADIEDKASAYVTMRFNGDVAYEWWPAGDYCDDCCQLLIDALSERIQVPERYEKGFRDGDARVRRELEMIEGQRVRFGEGE